MARRVFLHVGSPKTGTTFLQTVLWAHKERAREDGLLLPLAGLRRHFEAALDVRGEPANAQNPDDVPGTWQRLVDQAEEWPGDVLVSHELFALASAEQAERAIAQFGHGTEVHVIVTARDLARQLPAEWQERVKHRRRSSFAEFMEKLQDPESDLSRRLWLVQDFADVLHRWGGSLPPARRHLVTVPHPGAPSNVLWERFAGLIGLAPDAYDLQVPRTNASLGLEQTELLRMVNVALGERLPRPGPYANVVKGLLAHEVLAGRPGSKVELIGPDLDFARAKSCELVERLRAAEVDVIGDLSDLLVPEDYQPSSRAVSARTVVVPERLASEGIEVTADLLERIHLRQSEQAATIRGLRAELAATQEQAREAEALLAHAHSWVLWRIRRRLSHLVAGHPAVQRLRPRHRRSDSRDPGVTRVP